MPTGMSITPEEELVVACADKAMIVIFSPADGQILTSIPLLEPDISRPKHAVVLPSRLLAVSTAGPLHRVWLIRRDGTVKRFYGVRGRATGQPFHPRGLLPFGANQNTVMVCDRGNHRLVAIDFEQSQSEELASDIDGLISLAVDILNRRLYVGQYQGDRSLLIYKF